jgi:hypothetical protein
MRYVLLALPALLFACDDGRARKAPPPPAPGAATTKLQPSAPPPAAPAKSAPAEVPQAFVKKVEAEWAAIRALGDQVAAQLTEARTARASGDRATLKAKVEAGKQAFNALQDAWAALYYAEHGSEALDLACQSWMDRTYGAQMKSWEKMGKALKELSTN